MACTPDGIKLLTVGVDDKALVWDLVSRQPLMALGRALNACFSVAVSADGERIAPGTSDGLIRTWNVRTCQELVTSAKQAVEGALTSLGGGVLKGSRAWLFYRRMEAPRYRSRAQRSASGTRHLGGRTRRRRQGRRRRGLSRQWGRCLNEADDPAIFLPAYSPNRRGYAFC